MKFNSNLNHKLLTYWDSVVDRGYSELRNMSACAGIKGEIESANKARRNHYGQVIMKGETAILVPPRPWVNVGLTEKTDRYTARLAAVIKDQIKPAKIRTGSVRTTPFGGGSAESRGPQMVLRAIAEQMEKNQKRVITAKELRRNAPSTIKRKGRNSPMIWTGAMYSEIDSWVEVKE